MSDKIPGVPEGWELVELRRARKGEYYVDGEGRPQSTHADLHAVWPIIRKTERPAKYRPFANGAEYMASKVQGIAVDWDRNNDSPGFFAVVSANRSFLWVAIGDVIERFGWEQAFEKLQFRHTDNSTSPFGAKIDE